MNTAIQSATPLKDAYQAKINALDRTEQHKDDNIKLGYYAAFSNSTNNIYTGFITKIGRRFVTIETPYGGYGGNDYLQIMELKFDKAQLLGYYKPIETA